MKIRIQFLVKNAAGLERSDDPVIETRAKTFDGIESALRAAGLIHNDERLVRAWQSGVMVRNSVIREFARDR